MRAVFGVLLVGVFSTIVLSFLFTESLLKHFDVRRRILTGDGWPLITIVYANSVSFLMLCIGSFIVLFAADGDLPAYAHALLVCACAQGVWLGQHLWFYHRDHLRFHYE